MLPSPLLDPPPLSAARFAEIEDAVARLLDTRRDLVLLQAEAILALEAVARGVGAPGRVCLNLVSGPYGALFGDWLAQAGAEVIEVRAPFDGAIETAHVAAALAARPDISVVALVHAESATGTVNPLDEIVELARARGALTIVDAVASAGGHPLAIDRLDLDFCVVGPQKALAGPAGVSVTAISDRGWEALEAHPRPWRASSLSLLDWRERWIEPGRRAIPGTPAVLEMLALEAAVERVAAEGLDRVIRRHERCAAACRAGVRSLGADLWVGDDAIASTVATTVRLPPGVTTEALIGAAREHDGFELTPGAGELRDQVIRIDHWGSGAVASRVLAAVAALGTALDDLGVPVDIAAGLAETVARLARHETAPLVT